MANATYAPIDLNTKPRHVGGYGDATIIAGKVTLPTSGGAFVTTDKARMCRIPAGVEVNAITLGHADCDTGTGTLTVNVGYEPCDANEGPLAAAPSYFAAADAGFAAASSGRVLSNFDPIKFEQDVWLTLIPAVNGNALGANADIRANVFGTVKGVR